MPHGMKLELKEIVNECKKHGITQADMSDVYGCSRQYIGSLFRNYSKQAKGIQRQVIEDTIEDKIRQLENEIDELFKLRVRARALTDRKINIGEKESCPEKQSSQ